MKNDDITTSDRSYRSCVGCGRSFVIPAVGAALLLRVLSWLLLLLCSEICLHKRLLITPNTECYTIPPLKHHYLLVLKQARPARR